MNISNLINELKAKQITLYSDGTNIKIIGPRSEVTKELKMVLKENKQEIINFLNKDNIEKVNETEDECYPLSSAQKRMYVLNNVDKDNVSYNVPFIIKVTGKLDIKHLEECIKKIIDRHESLRTHFLIKNSEVVQKIEKHVDFNIKYSFMEGKSIEEKIKDFIKPFDLKTAPLMHVEVCNINEEENYLMIDMNHIITDGLSMNIFINELSKLYVGQELEKQEYQYKDYSEWQRKSLTSEKLIKEKEYWLNIFNEPVKVLDIATDYIRPKVKSYEGNTIDFSIDNNLKEKIKSLAKENEVTLYMMMLGIYAAFLSRYANQNDIVIGSPVEGRTNEDLKNIIGMFVNTLPLRLNIERQITFREFLKEVKLKTIGAYENQNYQFDKLVEELDIEQDTSRSSLFDTMFDLQNEDDGKFEIEGLTFEPYKLEGDTAKFDLSLTAIEAENSMDFQLEYCTKLFTENTANIIGKKFINVLDQIINNIDIKLKDISMLSKEEEDIIINEFNREYIEEEKVLSLNKVFENSVKRTPDNIAAIYKNESITYRKLNEKANKLARYLIKKGIKSNDIVGIMVERSIDMLVGLIAILKSGAAYMPIDPDYPMDRINYMIEDSKTPLILTQEKLKERLVGVNTITFNEEEINEFEDSDLLAENKLNDLAYVIYTSGTTGKPKGVLIKHKNVINYISSFLEQVDLTEEDTILQVVSFAFDAFVEELYPILSKSGKIVISENFKEIGIDGLVEAIDKYNITFISCSPLLLNELDKHKKLKINNNMKFVSGGDTLKYDYVKNIIKYADVYNSYGPTEATVCATYYKMSSKDKNKVRVPIGKVLKNYKVVILDEENNIAPIGTEGELCIGGKGLALGYLNNESLTKKKFTKHGSFGDIYHTGDLAKWLPDGNIDLLGRNDSQVKIRGYRIELQEIEFKLLSCNGVNDAIAIAKESEGGDKYLCAYISGQGLDINNIRKSLSNELPSYMMPSYIIEVEKIPRTINGKVDKKALKEPMESNKFADEIEPPKNFIEEKMVNIWKEVLNLKKVGVTNNFFEVGGHSLKALTLATKIHEVFQVEISLNQIFASQTIRELAKVIEGKEKNDYKEIRKAPKRDYYKMTSAQKRLYLLNTIEEDNIAYNVPFAMNIKGDLNINKLEESYNKLINRHESLRTSFVIIDGEPVQKIEKDIEFKIEYYEEVDKDNIENTVNTFVKSFRMDKAPLLRVKIIKVKEREHILLMDIHHIICDGFSMDILIKELFEIYEGEEKAPLSLQYKDYSEWKKDFEESEQYKEEEKYWLKEFSGEIPILNMPIDYKRSEKQIFEGEVLKFNIDKKLSDKLREISKSKGITMNMLLLAAYSTLLYKYSGQSDIVIGSPIIGRNHRDLNNIIGMFVNTLPLRNYPEGSKRFSDYLNEVKMNCINAFDNQDYDFYDLIEKLNIKRSSDRNPLFDTTFNMSETENNSVEVSGLTFETYPMEFNTSKFDFTLSAIDSNKEIYFILRYCKGLFKKETMERLSNHFINLLNNVVSDLDIKLEDIEIVSPKEKEIILNEFNNTSKSYKKDKTIIELFEYQVKCVPDNIAVEYEDEKLTYRELNNKANSLARTLREKGIGVDSIVGIMLDRSVNMIVSILAALKAGGAYMPIDPNYPEDRINYMLSNSNAQVLLTEKEFIKKVSYNVEILDIEDKEVYSKENGNLNKISFEDNLAYVIYTSGTTGKAKGVMIRNKSLVNYCCSIINKANITIKDKTALLSSYAFDLGHTAVFTSLISGITLKVVPENKYRDPESLIKYIEDGITYIKITPSLFSMIVNSNNVMRIFTHSNLRLIVLGGESIDVKNIKKLNSMDKNNKVNLMNHYGPTESTVGCISTIMDINSLDEAHNIIGKPLDNIKIYILNDKNNIMPIGVAGELCVSGEGLAKGYINNEELTKKKFIENPYIKGEKLYKTGDLARWMPDGNIEFLGRVDDQVKVHGYRIEVKEIENQLLENESIEKAIVISKKDKNDSNYLCAYVVLKDSEISTSEIRSNLQKKLPNYMIPSFFVKLEEMPITANGKIDKKLLPEPNKSLEIEEDYEEPRNEIEKQMVNVWEDVLDVKGISINTNFFEAGGDSIKALQIISKLSKFNLKLEMKDIFEKLKIKDISQYVKVVKGKKRNNETIEGEVKLTPIQRRFFNNKEEVNHYNQAFILYKKTGFKEEVIKKVFKKIVEQHDALRMIFIEKDGQAIEYNRSIEEGIFDLYTYDFRGERNLEEKISNTCTKIQEGMDIYNGKIIKLAIFNTDNGDHLLIAIHHLVVDGVSWRILFEDIQSLYKQAEEGEELVLEDKTSSYKEFASKLEEYSNGNALLKEKSYWNEIEEAKVKHICESEVLTFGNYEGAYTVSEVLTEEDTENLLKETNKAYNTQINDILLTALVRTTRDLTGDNKLKVVMEGHGREDILEGIDISRTVGWFTSIYPIFIDLGKEEEISSDIKTVKETLRKIPNKGVGYSILRYLSKDNLEENSEKRAEIQFNYLGEIDNNVKEADFSMSKFSPGETIGGKVLRNTPLEITSVIANKQLIISITYDKKLYESNYIEELNKRYKENLKLVIDHCINKEQSEKTASDYGYKDISAGDLEDILSFFE